MPITLPDAARDEAVAAIQQYAADEFDEPLGNIAAGALLDFFLEEVAPSVYNRAVADVQERLQVRLMELDVEMHAEEFPRSRR